MSQTILLRRGQKAQLPASLGQGEPAYTTDTKELFIGNGEGEALEQLPSMIMVDAKDPKLNDSRVAGLNRKDALDTIYAILSRGTIDNPIGFADQGIVVDNGANAYYPSLLFDPNGFGANDGYNFKILYSVGTVLKVIKSKDCITWTTPETCTGLDATAHHPTWIYDAGGFGTQGNIKYKIWYWDSSVSNLLISTIRYAESADGVTWVNDQAITQDATNKLITGVAGSWNSATWGFQKVFYNGNAKNTGTDPFDYSYTAYYDCNTGTTYQTTGLAYSIDGKNWIRYAQNAPVLDRTSGDNTKYDYYCASFGSITRDVNGFHCWYSGGVLTTYTDNFCIAYAHSIDGINWVKNANNPIFKVTDGITYRDERCYTPSVVDDGNGNVYMIYTACGSAQTGRKKLGLATLKYQSYKGSTPVISNIDGGTF